MSMAMGVSVPDPEPPGVAVLVREQLPAPPALGLAASFSPLRQATNLGGFGAPSAAVATSAARAPARTTITTVRLKSERVYPVPATPSERATRPLPRARARRWAT